MHVYDQVHDSYCIASPYFSCIPFHFHAAPAVIAAAITTYISTVGSNVTLTCSVSDKGTPPATFSWRRNGYELNNNNNIVNDTIMALVLTNVTMESAGTYVCSGTGVLSYRSDAVELIVEGTYICMY